ncbi:9122_t:CDS:2, partial [Racocetra fulgida]
MANSRTEAKELPCVFSFLVQDYPGSELAKCETPEKQHETKFCDFGIQVSLPNPEYDSLVKKINELECLNKQLLLENKILKRKLSNKFDNQEERVKSVIEIAKRERSALYDDV